MYPSFDRSEGEAFDKELPLITQTYSTGLGYGRASEGHGSSEGRVALDGITQFISQDQSQPGVGLALAIRYSFEPEQLIVVHPCD